MHEILDRAIRTVEWRHVMTFECGGGDQRPVVDRLPYPRPGPEREKTTQARGPSSRIKSKTGR